MHLLRIISRRLLARRATARGFIDNWRGIVELPIPDPRCKASDREARALPSPAELKNHKNDIR
jgi:hypothetical protein